MKLTDAKLRTLPNPVKTRKVPDGSGSYLELTYAGGRYWLDMAGIDLMVLYKMLTNNLI